MQMSRRQELACRAREMRRNMTRCEKKLWFGFLAEHNPPFRAQKVVGNYILDFYCHKARLCIEVDGDTHYEPHAMKYDDRRSIFLEMEEIKVLRFTNNEIDESFEGVCMAIEEEIYKRRNDIHTDSFAKLKSKR